MLNRITFIGSIGRDPELKQTPSGISVVTLQIACERDFKESDGTRAVDWISTVAWRNTADYVAKYVHKGDRVSVDGRLQSREYTDKNGNKKTIWEVKADNVSVVSHKPGNTAERVVETETESAAVFEEAEDDGTLPF